MKYSARGAIMKKILTLVLLTLAPCLSFAGDWSAGRISRAIEWLDFDLQRQAQWTRHQQDMDDYWRYIQWQHQQQWLRLNRWCPEEEFMDVDSCD